MDAVMERTGLAERLEAAAVVGMTTAVWAEAQPDKAAVIDPDGRARTFAEVNANSNRIVRLLRQAGLKAGDAVAVLMSNRGEFVEIQAATLRGGFRIIEFTMTIPADPSAIPAVTEGVNAMLVQKRWPEEQIMQIELALQPGAMHTAEEQLDQLVAK